jgi:HEAT repeat protein
LIRALADPSEPVRLQAVRALASCDPTNPGTLHALQQILTNSTAAVAGAAQTALITVGKPAVPILATALADKDRRVRVAAAETLKKIGTEAADAVPVLLNAVKDSDRDVRVHCTNALRDIDATAPVAQQAFLNGLQDSDEEVRIAAHLALVKLGKAAIPVLTGALKRPEVTVRRGVIETLKKIATEVQDGRAEVYVAVPDLIHALADASKEVREEAGWALAEIDGDLKSALPVLMKALAAPRKTSTARLLLQSDDLRFTPLPRLLAAAITERGPRLQQVLSELEQRRDTQVLVTFSLSLSHEKAEVQQQARTLLVGYLAHRPTEQEQKDAAGKLYLHKLLAQSGKADKARERYRELVLASPRTQAAEEARRLLTNGD